MRDLPSTIKSLNERLSKLTADEATAGYASECVRVRQDLAIAESQLRDYHARLGKPFPHEGYLTELTELRDQLKAKLSAGHESGEDRGPAASELADRIKALKAANTIEAAPQRVRQKQAAAEEPITARIRRRREANTVPGETRQGDGDLAAGETFPTTTGEHSPCQPPMTFQQRIILERQCRTDGPNPS